MRKAGILFIILMSTLLGACGFSIGYSEYKYMDSGDYKSGNAQVSEKIVYIDIDWQSGAVNIDYWDKPYISLEETSNMELVDSIRLHYLVVGDKLNVKYCASGEGTSLINLKKTLTVKIPKDSSYDKINISTASSDIVTAMLEAKEIDLVAASGSISAIVENSSDVSFTTASGSIDANVESASKVSITAASGSVDAILKNVVDAELTTASGDITVKQKGESNSMRVESASGKIEVKANNVTYPEVNSSSGNIKLKFKVDPVTLDIRTTSGKATIQLPQDSQFTTTIKSASGEFDCDFDDVVRNGKNYTRGNGKCDINISTTSGNIKLKPIVEEEE